MRLDKMNFVVFNGPSYSGKTTSANALVRILKSMANPLNNNALIVEKDSFAAPMKRYLTVALNMPLEDMQKDTPMAILSGYSPREFLIKESEDHMKPTYGQDIFGRLLLYRALRYTPAPNVIVVDDGGIEAEFNCLGEYKPFLVRMNRPGYSFKNDNRSYLPNPWWGFLNDGDIDYQMEVVHVLAEDIYQALTLEQ